MSQRTEHSPADSRRIRAEAASWVARLHGPDRNTEIEVGLKRWLAESSAHAAAFEAATDVWQETADLPAELPSRTQRSGVSNRRGGYLRAAAVAAGILVMVAAGTLLYSNGFTLNTRRGEQRTVALNDGTRVELNTDSEISVQYDEQSRTVVLKSGEAFFDVAKRPAKPFVVIVGSHEVIALGTAFVIRRDGPTVSVALIEGKVAVRSAPDKEVTLTAGQRVTFPSSAAAAQIDQPDMNKVTAWQRGQLIFEDIPLHQAVAEFNRYGNYKIILSGSELEAIPVGGVFRVGDFMDFARAVAVANDLQVLERADEIVLARP